MGLLRKWWSLDQSESDRTLGLETSEQYKERWISIRVFYCMGFLLYFAFNVVVTGLWPYLKTLDPEANKTFLTYLFAMPSVMQLVFSPLFGWWTNRISSTRIPIAISLVAFIAGHVLYAAVEDIPAYRKEVLLLSRAIAGLATITSTIYRAYISSATTLAERTKTVSNMNLAHTLGLLAGSAFQPVLSLLGKDGYRLFGFIRINMFSSVGWIGVALGSVVLAMMMPCVFKEHHIAVKEIVLKNSDAVMNGSRISDDRLRYHPIGLMLMVFALVMFSYKAVQS
nr:major facilitator superfamily domain-containing protein 8-like [Aedes albopictus]